MPDPNKPEESSMQGILDAFNVGMKPSRSDSSSGTFVATAQESMRHEQHERIEGRTGVTSLDAPNDQVTGEQGTPEVDPEKRSTVNPGGIVGTVEELRRKQALNAAVNPQFNLTENKSNIRPLGISEDDMPDAELQEMYVAGRRVTIDMETKQEYERLLNEMGEAQRGRPVGDIPANDEYHQKAAAFNSFVGSIR